MDKLIDEVNAMESESKRDLMGAYFRACMMDAEAFDAVLNMRVVDAVAILYPEVSK